MKRILFIFIFSTSLFHYYSQGFRTRFKEPHAADNSARAIFEINAGNYIGAGFATDTSSGFSRSSITVMGLDAQGQVQWVKKHHGGSIEYINNPFSRRCFYKQGNYLYYAGAARDSSGGNGRMYGVLIKYNLNGDTLWRKMYHGVDSLEDVVPQMVTTSIDGGFLMTGFFQHWGGSGGRPCLLIKTDGNGNELWRQHINKTGHNVSDGKAIVQDSASKKIAIVGYQYIGTPNNFYHSDHILVTDSLGIKLFQGKYTTNGGIANDLIQTSDKKLVMVGYQFYPELIGGSPTLKSFAAKFNIDSPATPIWKVNGFDKQGLHNGFTCAVGLKNGDVLVGGLIDTIYGTINGPLNAVTNDLSRLTVINSNGQVKWNRYYDYKKNDSVIPNNQGPRSINLCNNGDWVASIGEFNYGVNPFFFVKYDSTGCDSTLEYCEMLTSVGLNEKEPVNNLIRLFPNPFKNEINIRINNGHTISEFLGFRITNVLGKTLIEGNLNEHLNIKPINLSELPTGVYFFETKIDNRNYHFKILKE